MENEEVVGNNPPVKPTGNARSIAKTLAYHKPSAKGLETISRIRAAYSDVLELIQSNCPNSRERAVAITELETSAMWAVKSVVCNDPESEVEGAVAL